MIAGPVLAAILLWWPAPATAEPRVVYRCEAQTGTVVFSDAPCGPDARRLQLPEAPAVSSPPPGPSGDDSHEATSATQLPPSSRSRVPGLDCPSAAAIRQAVHDHRVVLCMTADEVLAAQPLRYNDHTVQEHEQPDGSVLEEWIYRFHYTTWPQFIWFSEGYVVEIQG